MAAPEVRLFASDLWQHARRRARRAAVAAAFCVAVGLCLAMAAPSGFRSTAVLAVLPAPEYTVREPAGARAAQGYALALAQIMSAEAALLGSEDVADDAVAGLGLARAYPDIVAPSPVSGAVLRRLLSGREVSRSGEQLGAERLVRATRVLPARDSNVITLELRDRRADMAPVLLRALLGAYAARRGRLYADPQLPAVEQEVRRAEADATAADARFATFRRERAVVDLQQERDILLRRRDEVAALLAESDARAGGATARAASLRRGLAGLPARVTLYEDNDDAAVTKQDERLIDLRARLAAVGAHYRDTSAAVRGLRAEISAAERARRALRHAGAGGTSRIGTSPEREALLVDKARADAEAEAAAGASAALRQTLWSTAQSLSQLDAMGQEYQRLARAKAAADDALAEARRVLAERRLMESAERMRSARIRVVQAPPEIAEPGPLKRYIALSAIFMGALVFVGRTVGSYLMRPVFYSTDTLARGFAVPVVCEMPAAEARRGFVPVA